MAEAKIDLSEWVAWRKHLEALPADLRRVGAGVVEDEAKGMVSDVATGYRKTFEAHKGRLLHNVQARKLTEMRWQVYNAWGTAHWFEFGTAWRFTRDIVSSFRGQIKVQPGGGETPGGFTGTKATARTKSTAVFRPVFIPAAIRRRARMVERLKGVLEQAGFTVTGDA